jgi:LacI family transcriptional regulator
MTDLLVTPGKRPTIDDVAARARVSKAAVSKVLRNAYGVSDEMRARVTKAIEDLGYRPLVAARGLRGTTLTLGMTIPQNSNPFFETIVRGATDALLDTRYQLIIAPGDDLHTDGRRAIESLYDRQVNGVLAVSPTVDPSWLAEIGRRIPLVELGRHDESDTYDVIVGDDRGGTRAVMEHLFGLGHVRIAHLEHIHPPVPARELLPPAIRAETFRQAMHERGLEDNMTIIGTTHQDRAAALALSRALEKGGDFTAVFAGNDDAALGALRVVARRPGQRISIVGYDNSEIAGHPMIDLTSVDHDGYAMGRLAMGMLIERIGGRTEPRRVVMDTRLVVRGSTLPVTKD